MVIESSFSANVLKLDCAKEIEEITKTLRKLVLKQLTKRDVVVALSGGMTVAW